MSKKTFILGERATLNSDIWALAAVIVQWLLETPPWDFQELCARYKYRENKHVRKCHTILFLVNTIIHEILYLGGSLTRSYE